MKKLNLLILILISFILFGCNLSGNSILLINETEYTVFFEYRDGSKDNGADNMVTAEIAAESDLTLDDVELWGIGSEKELLYSGAWTDEGVDIDVNQLPGTILWPLTVRFTEE